MNFNGPPPPPIGMPPLPPSDPEEKPRKTAAPEGRVGPFATLISSLIIISILVAGVGFFGHMLVDLFDWAWDLWGSF